MAQDDANEPTLQPEDREIDLSEKGIRGSGWLQGDPAPVMQAAFDQIEPPDLPAQPVASAQPPETPELPAQ